MPSIPGIIRSSRISEVSGVMRSRKFAGSLVVSQFSPIVLASAETSSQTTLIVVDDEDSIGICHRFSGFAGKSLVGLRPLQGKTQMNKQICKSYAECSLGHSAAICPSSVSPLSNSRDAAVNSRF